MKRKRIDVDTSGWRKTETQAGRRHWDMRSALETGEPEGVIDTRCESPKLGTYT